MTCSIRVYSERMVNPTALTGADIDLADIAHALSLVNRFGGHTPGPYSVAQHSVHVMQYVALTHPRDHELLLAALTHDASEAYLGDITRPLKRALPLGTYQEWERTAQHAVAEVLGINPALYAHPAIHRADDAVLEWEWVNLFGSHCVPATLKVTNNELFGQTSMRRFDLWSWRDARYQFTQTLKQQRDMLAVQRA